jgi:hypothetical protein
MRHEPTGRSIHTTGPRVWTGGRAERARPEEESMADPGFRYALALVTSLGCGSGTSTNIDASIDAMLELDSSTVENSCPTQPCSILPQYPVTLGGVTYGVCAP